VQVRGSGARLSQGHTTRSGWLAAQSRASRRELAHGSGVGASTRGARLGHAHGTERHARWSSMQFHPWLNWIVASWSDLLMLQCTTIFLEAMVLRHFPLLQYHASSLLQRHSFSTTTVLTKSWFATVLIHSSLLQCACPLSHSIK
jgi:hypothetical protein